MKHGKGVVAEHRHENEGRAARHGGKRHRRAAAVTAVTAVAAVATARATFALALALALAFAAAAVAAAILALASARRALRALPPLEERQLQPQHRQQLLAARAPVQLHPASLAEARAQQALHA